jgi:hypothetical protein
MDATIPYFEGFRNQHISTQNAQIQFIIMNYFVIPYLHIAFK